ncbi:MAG: hypothetical protein HWN68_00830 [Desulfobacterales bacterium]|nr:hypothetical protein [Desulfobacterales bacterium]
MRTEKANVIIEMQEELFRKQGEGWFRIVSGSMRPLIDAQDRVLAKHMEADEVEPGDIILFKNSHVLVTHRVIRILRRNGKTMILQRGDAGGSASTVAPESVMGKVVAVEKDGRLLRLDCGWARVVNAFLGFQNCCSYGLHLRIAAIRGRLGDKPGFQYLRNLYRILRKPFAFLNRAIARTLLT